MLDYTDTHCIERELLLAKVSILGPEYLEEQLLGGPTHEPRRIQSQSQPQVQAEPEPVHSKLEREAALAQHFEHSAQPEPAAPLTPSQALRLKSDNLQAIETLAKQFGGQIVDVSEHSVIVEMSGKTKRVEAFLSLLKPFGLLESARTGELHRSYIDLRGVHAERLYYRSHGHAEDTDQEYRHRRGGGRGWCCGREPAPPWLSYAVCIPQTTHLRTKQKYSIAPGSIG